MNFNLKLKTLALSYLINKFNGDNYHNASKFFNVYKIWNNIRLDSVPGDYIEFGIFKGKTLLHSLKTYNKLFPKNQIISFYGLDSFDGFPADNHEFYNKMNFQASFEKVRADFSKYQNVNIYKGFFTEVLKEKDFTDLNFSFVFIDCDIYESSIDVFKYIENRISKGGFLMIDDFTSIDKNGNSIYKAFKEIINSDEYIYFSSYSSGRIYRKL